MPSRANPWARRASGTMSEPKASRLVNSRISVEVYTMRTAKADGPTSSTASQAADDTASTGAPTRKIRLRPTWSMTRPINGRRARATTAPAE